MYPSLELIVLNLLLSRIVFNICKDLYLAAFYFFITFTGIFGTYGITFSRRQLLQVAIAHIIGMMMTLESFFVMIQ